MMNEIYLNSVQDGIYALGKAHNYALHPVSQKFSRSTPSLRSFPAPPSLSEVFPLHPVSQTFPRSTPSLRCLPNVAFETVPMFV